MMASDLVFDYNSALIEYIKTIKLCEIDIDKSSLISTDDLKNSYNNLYISAKEVIESLQRIEVDEDDLLFELSDIIINTNKTSATVNINIYAGILVCITNLILPENVKYIPNHRTNAIIVKCPQHKYYRNLKTTITISIAMKL